ncbi:MAG TPA: two-component regulator propeller domain-containing protein, partial [Flavobacterium sp.]|nr:two-component regulator propeller domain-containing protein [Flavobacterium sp.]
MKKHVLLFFIFIFQFGFAQSNLNWKGYFSYNQIKDITEASDRIIGAAENALFSKNILSNTIKTTNTIDGLSGQPITAVHHSQTFKKTIIGYENGLLIVVNDIDGSVTNVVDIINKSIPPNIKRVNHFLEHEGIIYISCDFGIVQYNINTLEFGDTYFIGPNGAEIKIYQTAILNNEIYAVTVFNGIKKAALTNPNLNDFNQWQTFDAGFWNGLVSFNNQLVGSNLNNRVYKYNGSFFEEIVNLNQVNIDIRTYDDKLIITTLNNVYVYNTSFNQLAHIQTSQITDQAITFTCATVINNTIYIGTNENGILTSTIESPTSFEYIMPDGPNRNKIFSISSSPTNLWAVYGGYNSNYNPYLYIGISLSQFGVSKFSGENGWLTIPYSDLLEAKALTRITIAPNNENQVYVSSYNNGLVKIEDDVPTTLFQSANSDLESIFSGSLENIRIGPSIFDRTNNLWVTNSRIKNGLKVLKPTGQWQTYDMESILLEIAGNDFSRIVIDRNGTKWIGSSKNGVIAFNETTNVFKKILSGVDEGNLPSTDVRALAIDNRNQVWIGTTMGLR